MLFPIQSEQHTLEPGSPKISQQRIMLIISTIYCLSQCTGMGPRTMGCYVFIARVCSTTGGYVFTMFTTRGGGGGGSHLHPIILPGPMSFLGGTPVTGPRSLPRGGTPVPVLARGYPMMMAYPHSQVRMGYPPRIGYAWTGQGCL